jgi:hypothetical protein
MAMPPPFPVAANVRLADAVMLLLRLIALALAAVSVKLKLPPLEAPLAVIA